MKLSTFLTLPLLRSFISIDTDSGVMVRHEVRRDPSTGLTLTAPIRAYPQATQETTT